MANLGNNRPSGRGMREPTSNRKENGRVVNPPRYPEMGGFSSAAKGFKRNDKSIRKPGAAEK
jgi:hypothetical protein